MKALTEPVRTVYRYLDGKYADAFFKTGSLQLTTLAVCRSHPLESRADTGDGKLPYALKDGDQMMAGVSVAGRRSYMLCASFSNSSTLLDRFGTDSGIEIINPSKFAKAVADVLGCSEAPRLSACRYLSPKEFNEQARTSPTEVIQDLYRSTLVNNDDVVRDNFYKTGERLSDIVGDHLGDGAYFTKAADLYEIEQEFRFFWEVDHDVTGTKVIRCPEAIPYCRPYRAA